MKSVSFCGLCLLALLTPQSHANDHPEWQQALALCERSSFGFARCQQKLQAFYRQHATLPLADSEVSGVFGCPQNKNEHLSQANPADEEPLPECL